MNDLQAKFTVSLVAVGLFFAYAFPTMKKAIHDHDGAIHQVGTVYMDPSPNDPNAPHGNVSTDDLQKYEAQKAAEERRAEGL